MAILEVENVSKRFGGIRAVDGVSLRVEEGEILGLIGPNGAGKTTLFSLMAGSFPPDTGRVLLAGRDISRLAPHAICHLGLVRTFQVTKPFLGLSVLDNVVVAALMRTQDVREARKMAAEIVDFVGLGSQAGRTCRILGSAERKRLELARALATQPRVMLLDEVMAGLTPAETEHIVALLRQIRERGITLVVVEHVMHAIMSLSDRVMVLHNGKELFTGLPEAVMSHPEVIKAYLGEDWHA